MSFLQKMAAIQKAHAAKVAQIQTQPGLDEATREQRLAAAAAERGAAITRLASQSADEPSATEKSVGAPCAACAASGVRSRANRCAARQVGVACGVDTFRCRNCPRDGGTRSPCRLCAAA